MYTDQLIFVSVLLLGCTVSAVRNDNSSYNRKGNNGRGNNHSTRSCGNHCLYGRSKPNIIYIMADDLGWNDIGFHNSKIKTPNINWLASQGIELTDYHAQQACTPSRSALMTGRYPSNNGLQQFIMQRLTNSCLPLEHKLLPEHMRDAGYTTKYIGKWHLGSCNAACLPTNRGFDEFRGNVAGITGYFDWSNRGVMDRFVNDQPSTDGIGTHLAIEDKMNAREMITAHAGNSNPLFMIISPQTPNHINGVPQFEVTPEMFAVHDSLLESVPEQRLRRQYLGLVSAFDDIVGETIDSLRDANMLDNTVIIVTSDNGGSNLPLIGPSLLFGSNYPLRGGKGSVHDGGTRMPTIYYDPRLSRRTRGTKRNFLMHITDWIPTFLDLAKVRRNTLTGIDGISQAKNLRNYYKPADKYKQRDELLIAITDFNRVMSECSVTDAAFRMGDWKLIYGSATRVVGGLLPEANEYPIPAESPELPVITGDSCLRTDSQGNTIARCLFNMEDDPSEQTNLFDQRPDIVQTILAKINCAKEKSVENVFDIGQMITPFNTRPLGSHTVPRTDFCIPSIAFPLEPVSPTCLTN